MNWLLRTTVEGTLLIAVVMLVIAILGRNIGPRWRIALWVLVGLKLLVPASMPFSPGLGSWADAEETPELPIAESTTPVTAPLLETTTSKLAMAPPIGEAETLPATGLLAQEPPNQPSFSLASLVLALWVSGTLIYLLALSLRLRLFVRKIAGPNCPDQRLLDLVAEAAQEMGLRRDVTVVLGPQGTTPAVFGMFRPRLLLPEDWENQFDEDGLRYILMHELEHVRFDDVLWNWVAAVINALHWFNPLVWLAARRFQSDRELRCDADTLARLGDADRIAYARTLLDVQENFRAAPAIAGLAPCVRRQPALRHRITMITRPATNRRWLNSVFTLALATLFCLSFGSAQVDADPKGEKKTKPEERRVKITLKKDGAIVVDDKEIAVAKLVETLKAKNASQAFVYQDDLTEHSDELMEGLRASGISMATFRDENDETLFRLRYRPDAAGDRKQDQAWFQLTLLKDGVLADGKKLSYTDLVDTLKKGRFTGVEIDADIELPFEEMKELSDALEESGIKRIRFASEKKADPAPAAGRAPTFTASEWATKRTKVEIGGALRALHMAASNYLVDNKTWPQCPFDEAKDPKKHADWWKKALEPYETSEDDWQAAGFTFKPGNFQKGPLTAYRWEDRPWFEGSGILDGKKIKVSILPDGRILIPAPPAAPATTEGK